MVNEVPFFSLICGSVRHFCRTFLPPLVRGPIESPTLIGFTSAAIGSVIGRCAATDRPTKITFADMRDQGVRGLRIYRADYRCSHSIAISGDRWPDDARLSSL